MKRLSIAIIFVILNGIYSEPISECLQVDARKIKNACQFGGLEFIASSNISVINKDNCNIMRSKNEFRTIPKAIRMANAQCPGAYVIFMLDRDSPDLTPGSFYNHMTLSRVDCKDLQTGSVRSATTTLRYEPPNPQTDSGIHHYMILIYRQKQLNMIAKKIGNTERNNWSLSNYVAQQPNELCGPVAGVQFRIEA